MKKIAAVLAFIALFATSAEASPEGAKSFVATLGNRVLDIVKTSKSDAEKEKSLTAVFNDNVDTEWMSKFVLGKYYRTTPQEKLAKYNTLYRTYVMNSYIPRFRDYTGEKFKVTGAKTDKGNHIIVSTDILRPNGQQPVKVDYRIIDKGGSYKIVDIVVEGVSLITTQRSEFGSIISNSGFDTLVSTIQKKVSGKKES